MDTTFNNKKVYKQKCFSVTIKNLNWEILTKNLITFKRWDGVKDEISVNVFEKTTGI